MPRTDKRNPFNRIDAVFTVNLDYAISRWRSIQKEAETMGFKHKLERIPGVYHAVGGFGCAQSMKKCVRQASERGLSEFLLLQDDARFIAPRDEVWDVLNKALDNLKGKNWGMLYLGMTIGCKNPKTDLSGAGNPFNPALTFYGLFGVIINSSIYDTLFANIPDTIELFRPDLRADMQALKVPSELKFCVNPCLVTVGDFPSETGNNLDTRNMVTQLDIVKYLSDQYRAFNLLPRIDSDIKISYNMATYPGRPEANLKRVVDSILPHVDILRVYLNEYIYTPECLIHPKIVVKQGGPDLKDTGKFFWAGKHRDEYYFSGDDDIAITRRYIERHIEELKRYDGSAVVTSHGCCLKPCAQGLSRDDRSLVVAFTSSYSDDARVSIGGTGVMCFDSRKISIPLDAFKYHGMTDLCAALHFRKQSIPIIARAHKADELVNTVGNDAGALWRQIPDLNPQHRELLSEFDDWGSEDLPTLISVNTTQHKGENT